MSCSTCREFSIVASDCPCLLQLADPSGHILSLNLSGATVRPYIGTSNFHIQTLSGGAKVDGTLSAFTAADIEDLICACHASGSGGEVPNDTTVGRVILSGVDSWVVPAGLQSMAYNVVASGDVGVTPTITTLDGTSPLYVDESGGYSVIKDSDTQIIAPLTITTSSGDIVIVTYTL